MEHKYVHGYSSRESERLADQASTLSELLHHDTLYQSGETVLEAGCGTGAQTVILARQSPQTRFVSVDLSSESIAAAKENVKSHGLTNVTFVNADIFSLPFEEHSFDHIFVCFVLEHLNNPVQCLLHLKKLLKPGGTITVIEGDQGSAYFYPLCIESVRLIEILSQLQAQNGGNATIGRELYPLLARAGFSHILISPRMVYADGSQANLQKGFTLDTFTAMVEGIKEKALDENLADIDTWNKGIGGLKRSALADGVFCYTFFKGIAIKQ